MKNKSVGSVLQPFFHGIRRFHLTLFIILTTAGLALAVLTLDSILQQASDTSRYTSTSVSSSYDQATATALTSYYTSDSSPATYALPTGRVNPFAE